MLAVGEGERRAPFLLLRGLDERLSKETLSASQEALAYRRGETLLGKGMVLRWNGELSGLSLGVNGGRLIPSRDETPVELGNLVPGESGPVLRSTCVTRRFRLEGDIRSRLGDND